jgi:hypothetical protein
MQVEVAEVGQQMLAVRLYVLDHATVQQPGTFSEASLWRGGLRLSSDERFPGASGSMDRVALWHAAGDLPKMQCRASGGWSLARLMVRR